MKSIYTITLSDNGAYSKCATNMKALYKILTEIPNYKPIEIMGKPASYERLCYSITSHQMANINTVCRVFCEGGAVITIHNPIIISNCK